MLQLKNRHTTPSSPTPPASSGPPAAPMPLVAARATPPGNATLGISWLNNFLQVAVLRQGQVIASWSSPLSPDDTGDLGDLLKEAVKQTGFAGNTAALVLAHPQFIQQIIDAPPAKGAALDSYITHQLEQQKGAEGSLAWVAQPRLHGKTGQGLLLTLLPETFLTRLKREFLRAGLRLKVLIPVSAVLQEHLGKLPRGAEEIVMVVADTNGLTSLLVARPDGELLLGRSVAGGWSLQADRVAMDLKRTGLFVNQQAGQAVNSVWLLAPPPAEQMRRLQADLGIPVMPFPQELTPTFWAEAATRWPAERAPNLIPHEPEVAPRQQIVNRVVVTAATVVTLVALATGILLEVLARQERNNLARVQSQLQQLQARHLELQRQTGDVLQRRLAIRELRENRLVPMPAWFLGQLGEACPPTLLLTSSQIRREGSEWAFAVAGQLELITRTNSIDQPALEKAVRDFSAKLAAAPLHARLRGPAEVQAAREPSPAGGAFKRWAQSKGLNLAGKPADQRFVLEGALQ